ncbi:MAG: pyridoxal phosphate-dependent aminotransferase [Candidatus Cloacimonetes bacterium]|nr:pyridoxal phosphate-dependent aminotransferase [Candidatus Cloacimonadota bacterium]
MKDFTSNNLAGINKSAIRQIFDSAPKDSINLALGEILFPESQFLKSKAKEIISKYNSVYTTNAGLLESRESICNYYNNLVEPDGVCITNGAEEAIFATLFTIINPNDEILLANPTYLAYDTIIKMVKGKTKYFQLDPNNNFELNRDSFRMAITSKTKAVILCNPSNPLSKVFSNDDIKYILEIAEENEILVIIDEIYLELYLFERSYSLLSKAKNIIVISSLSKSHCMTGWRIGWAVSANTDLIDRITVAHQYISTCASFLSQKIIPFALSKKGMESVAMNRVLLRERQKCSLEFLLEHFPSLKYARSTHAPYLFLNFGFDDLYLTKKLVSEGVIVVPGSVFGANGKNYIRLNYATDKKKIGEALIKIVILSKNIE